MTVRLTRFVKALAIVDKDGRPTDAFLTALNRFVKETETAINAQPAIQAATEAANEAAVAANTAVEQIQAGTLEITAIQVPGGDRVAWDGSNFVVIP
jgi:plastocyanin